MENGTKRQRFNSKLKLWVISEYQDGNWNVISKQKEKAECINVSSKPQFRG